MAIDLRKAAETFARRDQRRRSVAQTRAERLAALFPAARRVLIEDYGAKEAILFGSLATGRTSSQSDVDIAVAGLPAQMYFEALADLMQAFGGPVDLVRLEEASPSLAERIRAEGRPL